jgi:hypothetical protein
MTSARPGKLLETFRPTCGTSLIRLILTLFHSKGWFTVVVWKRFDDDRFAVRDNTERFEHGRRPVTADNPLRHSDRLQCDAHLVQSAADAMLRPVG